MKVEATVGRHRQKKKKSMYQHLEILSVPSSCPINSDSWHRPFMNWSKYPFLLLEGDQNLLTSDVVPSHHSLLYLHSPGRNKLSPQRLFFSRCTRHRRELVCEALPVAFPMRITVPVTRKMKEQKLGKPQRKESSHARAFPSHYQLHVASWWQPLPFCDRSSNPTRMWFLIIHSLIVPQHKMLS